MYILFSYIHSLILEYIERLNNYIFYLLHLLSILKCRKLRYKMYHTETGSTNLDESKIILPKSPSANK